MRLAIPDRMIAVLLLLGGVVLIPGLASEQRHDFVRVGIGSVAALTPGMLVLQLSRGSDNRWRRIFGWCLVGVSIPLAWFLYITARQFCP